MSERENIQNRLEAFLNEKGLNEVYGVLSGLDTLKNGRKVRTLTFCAARTLDGIITIYSPNFITVRTNRTNTHRCNSVEEVEQYIEQEFC